MKWHALPAALLALAALAILSTCTHGRTPPRPERAALATASAAEGTPCSPAPAARCIKVDADGKPNPAGTSIASCTGKYPDYVVPASQFPASYAGPWFELAQNYPEARPRRRRLPWVRIDFRLGEAEATRYLYALRDYALQGMVAADFVPSQNKVRRWFHMPLMNFGTGRRELVHGLTRERTLVGPELGLKPGAKANNFAVGFYNDLGAATIGAVWRGPSAPDLAKAQFAEGSMVFKILWTTATANDFASPPGDLLAGAPSWQIATGNGQLTKIRLLQMDVAVRDSRANTTGWAFGTFAFDRAATDTDAWRRLRPVGLVWGNDPGYTPADQASGKPLKESFESAQIPAYAKAHLGWAGRINGPVDNPISACLSCHSTAQIPVDAPLAPFASACDSDAKKLHWFRNFPGDQAFGAVDSATCLPKASPAPALALDFSLQMQVAAQSVLQFGDVNPCAPPEGPGFRALAPALQRSTGAPRISRGGEGEGEE